MVNTPDVGFGNILRSPPCRSCMETGPSACDTVTVCGVIPATVTVTFAILDGEETLFAAYVATSCPEPVPEAVTVHHEASLEADQLELVVTVKSVVPAANVTSRLNGVTFNVGANPAWVTVMVCGVSPDTLTMILATCEPTAVFSR